MKPWGKRVALIALAGGIILVGVLLWPSLRAGNGVMSLHLQAVTTNEAGLPKYLFVLTNNAYDCVAHPRVMLTHVGGGRASFPYGFSHKGGATQKIAIGESAAFVFEYPTIAEWATVHTISGLLTPMEVLTWQAEIQCQRLNVPSLWETMERLNQRLELTVGLPRAFSVERGRSVQSQPFDFLSNAVSNTPPLLGQQPSRESWSEGSVRGVSPRGQSQVT